jgi:hypothetical protein
MRRLFILVIVVLISFSPLGGFLASGQEAETAVWNGVGAPEAIAEPAPLEEFLVGIALDSQDVSRRRSIGTRLPTGYRVPFRFDPSATDYRPQIPELEDAEFMVVIVESGTFVLNVLPSSPAFIVDPPAGTTISYMDVTGNWADPPDRGFTYTESNRVVLDENGEECRDLCTILPHPSELPPSAETSVAVLLEEGFTVQALARNVCLWCLLKDQEGSLLVYPYVKDGREFSWVRSFDEARRQASLEGVEFVQGDPASSDSAPVGMAWALFNPPSGCH